MKRNIISILAFMLIVLFVFPANAQDQSRESEKKWNFIVAPYFLFPSMKGDAAVSGINASIDASTGDLFDNLKFAFMIYGEAYSDKWAITLDALYMNLGMEGSTQLKSRTTEIGMKQFAITPTGMYRICAWFEAGVGLRINGLNSSFKIAPGDYILPGTDFSENKTWVDPLIVARAMHRFGDDKWRVGLYADIGGFGIGSKLTWQVYPFAGYQFCKVFELDLAWRWLGVNYETGSDTDYFLYDMVINGPEMSFIFHF